MKVIVAGSRSIYQYDKIKKVLDLENKSNPITEVVCGMARGADLLGKLWAEENGIKVKEFPANWDKFGKSAGYKRNEEMAKYADACIIFWDGKSKGSKHMHDICKKNDLPVKLFIIEETEY